MADKIDTIIEEINERKENLLKNLSKEDIAIYCFLKEEYAKGNILNNLVFQFVFKAYYGLNNARLSKDVQSHFFKLLASKVSNLREILSELYEISAATGRSAMQFSFATKLLHTVDNDKPIFDSNVQRVINLEVEGTNKEEKILSCLEVYSFLERLAGEIKRDDRMRKIIVSFRSKFKVEEDKISDVKVIDFFLWSLGALKKLE